MTLYVHIEWLTPAREQSNGIVNLGRQNRTTLPSFQLRRRPPPNRRENRPSKHDNAKYCAPLQLSPNVVADEELFEDDPLDYIRRDLEGSDSDTRRRSASDFVRGLMDHFEKSVTLIVNDYINHYLAEYAKSPAQNWRSKDTALFLFSAIAIKSSTAQGGVSSTNILVDVCQFWTDNAQSEFAQGTSHPVLQADYIRYIHVFRNQV
jgi:hypothetical protein